VMPSRPAQCLARTCQAVVGGLFGFSDDRRFFVPVFVLVFFVLVIIIFVGVSRRHRVAAAHDEAPNVLKVEHAMLSSPNISV
jgi:uncharacterized membrane protein